MQTAAGFLPSRICPLSRAREGYSQGSDRATQSSFRSGRSWSGMVKNRCKNGDYYWVLANVTPVVADGVAVGYVSVRTKPTRQHVAKACTLYAQARLSPCVRWSVAGLQQAL